MKLGWDWCEGSSRVILDGATQARSHPAAAVAVVWKSD